MVLNSIHNTWLDVFFKFVTNLGDGMFCLLIVALLFFLGKKKESVTILLAYISSGLAAQILKRIFHMPRPKVFFEQIAFHYPHFVEGVSMSGSNSFPSGHINSAFALATVIALVYKQRRYS
ncbi:phosphatase PAP2 family protein [Pedobacter cryoconitis]|uniref:Membrane-associated phospholipid phosphatase n=1 Tax=Pedobacter cryoconitis TaxID=188932 RepID=A0A7X0J1A9_9SPHI|nr:phosphatase PAP2 family protein [Pedobacter cryoconitis]MBB6498607.1 membrane-associated phospholipid phosphatase [Pedobacter cryoconitis]